MIYVVIGTKAQLIKMAPILRCLQDRKIPYHYISTGQHRATIDDILDNFKIKKPDYHLYQGKDITSLPQMLFWVIRILLKTILKRREIFPLQRSEQVGGRKKKDGVVLVHGDTFSTLLGALMGKVAGLKVAHVESGLRSFNLFQPFPEELTRILTFYLADYMFCPGEAPYQNLEKFSKKRIRINTQMNTLLDSLTLALPAIKEQEGVAIPRESYGVVTLHRFENFNSEANTKRVIEKVEQVASRKKLLFILHKITEQNLRRYKLFDRLKSNPNIEFRPRYDYFKFIKLLLHADYVISDGGSNQEECYYLGKPILLLRNVTEREEGIGRNAVIGRFDPQVIDDFTSNFERYKHPAILNSTLSPSEIIVNECKIFM